MIPDSTWRSPQGYGLAPQSQEGYDLPPLPDELLWTVCELIAPSFNCACLTLAAEVVKDAD